MSGGDADRSGIYSNFQWWRSHDQEHFLGPYDTRLQAIDELDGYGGEVAECSPGHFNLSVDADDFLQIIEEQNYDKFDPDGDSEVFLDVTKEDRMVLENLLRTAVQRWITSCPIQLAHCWAFDEIRNRERIPSDEEVEASGLGHA
jgi:hypothetical protein